MTRKILVKRGVAAKKINDFKYNGAIIRQWELKTRVKIGEIQHSTDEADLNYLAGPLINWLVGSGWVPPSWKGILPANPMGLPLVGPDIELHGGRGVLTNWVAVEEEVAGKIITRIKGILEEYVPADQQNPHDKHPNDKDNKRMALVGTEVTTTPVIQSTVNHQLCQGAAITTSGTLYILK